MPQSDRGAQDPRLRHLPSGLRGLHAKFGAREAARRTACAAFWRRFAAPPKGEDVLSKPGRYLS